jgi:hypothetical protein
MAPVALFWQFQ